MVATPNFFLNSFSFFGSSSDRDSGCDTRFFKAFPERVLKYSYFSNFCIFKWKPTTLFIEAYLEIRLRIWKVNGRSRILSGLLIWVMGSCILRHGSLWEKWEVTPLVNCIWELVGWLSLEVVYFTRALDMSNRKCYTSLGRTMKVMGSDIFGKLHVSFGWLVNYVIMFFHLMLLGGNVLLGACCGLENMW